MTEENYLKAQSLHKLIIETETTLRIIKDKCSIHAFVNGVSGGMDYNLSDNKDIHETIRKGMTDALEKRIEELKDEFASI